MVRAKERGKLVLLAVEDEEGRREGNLVGCGRQTSREPSRMRKADVRGS